MHVSRGGWRCMRVLAAFLSILLSLTWDPCFLVLFFFLGISCF